MATSLNNFRWRLSDQAKDLVEKLQSLYTTTSWFGKAKREASIADILDQIRERGEPGAICYVARCLFLSSQPVKIKASRTIHWLMSLVLPEQLLHLGEVLGRSWGWYISDAWDRLLPQDISPLLIDPGSKSGVLGLLSLHQNGYVRQEAVRLLALETNGDEIKYLLIRQNDWVNIISNEAQTFVNKRLEPGYLPQFVRCLPLSIHLLAFRRRDLSQIVHKVLEMLVEPRHDTILADVLITSGQTVRRKVVKLALANQPDQARIIHHGLSSADPIVRLACANQVGQQLTGPDLSQAVITLQQDRFMPVRREGFLIEAQGNPDAALRIWKLALLDSSASIRELARYSIGKTVAFDPAGFYRHYLAEKGTSLPAVCGLAESGNELDLAMFRKLIQHPQPKIREAAIRGLARVAKEGAVDDLLQSLRDQYPSVVREAKKQLAAFLRDVSCESLFAIAKDAATELARRFAVQLIFEKGKWESLPWLIRIASPGGGRVSALACRNIEAWFSIPLCNKVFSKPSAGERKAIDEAMNCTRLPEPFFGKLQGWIQAK